MFWGVWFLVCNVVPSVLSSFEIISLRKRELGALLCILAVVWLPVICMRGSRKFCQWGSNSDIFFIFIHFLVDKGRTEDPYNHLTLKSGPSLAHQRNAI